MEKRYTVIFIIVLVLVLGFITTKLLFTKFEENMDQLVLSEISDIDLDTVEDGNYMGSYSGFPVSAEVNVTISNHVMTAIELVEHNNGQGQEAEIIPEKVLEAQSLNVDTVSGATYSSKVILKAIQDAVLKAASS